MKQKYKWQKERVLETPNLEDECIEKKQLHSLSQSATYWLSWAKLCLIYSSFPGKVPSVLLLSPLNSLSEQASSAFLFCGTGLISLIGPGFWNPTMLTSFWNSNQSLQNALEGGGHRHCDIWGNISLVTILQHFSLSCWLVDIYETECTIVKTSQTSFLYIFPLIFSLSLVVFAQR